jgi:glycerol-3-phosphate dehydrogenase
VRERADTDVAIVGAGVVGCAIARELCRFDLRVTLLEAGPDVGAGTSKANTALLHTGFDAKPGTLEARLVARGYELLSEYAPRVGIPVEHTGALLVAWSDEQAAEFPAILEAGRANGSTDLREVDAGDLYRREPHLGPGAQGAIEVAREGLVCPFTTPLAYATEAVLSGCDLRRSTPVEAVSRLDDGGFRLSLPGGELTAGRLVNAAGLRSDEIDRMLGHDGFTVTPRRGELLVFDKLARPLVRHIVLAVPTKVTKGVLIAPTVFGNVMLGPTAEDVGSKDDTDSTRAGLDYLMMEGGRIMPIEARGDYVCAGGIRSTGLSASMAIAEHVREQLGEAGLRLEPKAGAPPEFRMPNIGEAGARAHQRDDLIAGDAEYGRIVCFCERVTSGEIRDALAAPVPAVDLDGLRRRTRAHMGRCQGFFCGAELAARLDTEEGG